MRTHQLTESRGAYIAVLIITLLDLPIELSKDSPAWSREGDTLLTNVAEWVGRCKSRCFANWIMLILV